MRHLTTLSVCAASLLCSTAAVAQVKRDLDSHEHGASQLNIILDANVVYLEFESPWMNLVGFEHQPSTPEQETAVNEAIALLESPMELFVPNAEAGCSVETADVESSMTEGEAHEHEAGHDEEHDDHGEDHAATDGHDEHEEEHDAHDEEHAAAEEHDDHGDHDEQHAENHSEVAVSYSYVCESMDDLSTLDVQVFQSWSSIEDVDVQMAGPAGQSAAELGADGTLVDLSGIQ